MNLFGNMERRYIIRSIIKEHGDLPTTDIRGEYEYLVGVKLSLAKLYSLLDAMVREGTLEVRLEQAKDPARNAARQGLRENVYSIKGHKRPGGPE